MVYGFNLFGTQVSFLDAFQLFGWGPSLYTSILRVNQRIWNSLDPSQEAEFSEEEEEEEGRKKKWVALLRPLFGLGGT